MRGSAKKANSREAFAAVFEKQTRRFSAFDLLGLSVEPSAPVQQVLDNAELLENPPSSPQISSNTNLPQALQTNREEQMLVPDPQVQVQGSDHKRQNTKRDRQAQALRSDREGQVLILDREGEGLVQYGTTQALTVRPKYLGLTVGSDLGLTPIQLGPDGQTQAILNLGAIKLLAPLQWAVWCSLQSAETLGRLTSYRQIAQETNATPDGVKKAINVIQKEGGIIKKEVLRSATEQGFRVKLNHEVVFRAVTLNEAKGVLKRGINLGLTGGGKVQDLRPDGQGMYVCMNIKQTNVSALLRIPPSEWKIREQTIIQIANALPDMTAIEFRLSLNYLVEQEKNAKEPIRNHNAWVKAAFERNKGPLVTEREIEARFEQSAPRRELSRSSSNTDKHDNDAELLRLYLACNPDERTQIDLMAEAKAAPLLKVVSEDKRAGVLEEARRDAARAFLFKKS